MQWSSVTVFADYRKSVLKPASHAFPKRGCNIYMARPKTDKLASLRNILFVQLNILKIKNKKIIGCRAPM